MHRQRNFLAMVTLAAAAATTPAWGQAVVPSAGSAGSGRLSAVSVPDFSGVWARVRVDRERRPHQRETTFGQCDR
jgi:hypothetical protein